jgi:hypothetical protein
LAHRDPAASAKIRLAEPDLALLSLSGPNGGRSSMVEPRIVVPDVAGSNPVGHPNEFLIALSQKKTLKAEPYLAWAQRMYFVPEGQHDRSQRTKGLGMGSLAIKLALYGV